MIYIFYLSSCYYQSIDLFYLCCLLVFNSIYLFNILYLRKRLTFKFATDANYG